MSTVACPWVSRVNWTVYTVTSLPRTPRSVSAMPATVVMTATSSVLSVAHVSMAAVHVRLDTVETRVNYSTAQVRTRSVDTTFFTSLSVGGPVNVVFYLLSGSCQDVFIYTHTMW